jgi:hypothetical protein
VLDIATFFVMQSIVQWKKWKQKKSSVSFLQLETEKDFITKTGNTLNR